MLLAEELLVLRMGPRLDGRVVPEAETALVGALVSELVLRGRAGVEPDAALMADALVVVDAAPLNDDLLDETLQLLRQTATPGSGGSSADAARPSPAMRALGAVSRRRLRKNGKVSEKDLAYWWGGHWTCAEFGGLAATLLFQLLVLQEGLDRVFERLCARLTDSGVLTRAGGQSTIDATFYVLLRERLRRALAGPHAPESRMVHLAALRSTDRDWVSRDIVGDRNARRRASAQAQALRNALPIANAVQAITKAQRDLEDWSA